jgi:hypothetical protein
MKVRFLVLASLFGLPLFPRAALADTAALPSSKDNTLYENVTGSLSNGIGEFMFSGRAGDGSKRRAVLAFDLSSIPSGATVTNVTLSLFMSRTLPVGAFSFELHRLLANWGEGASNAAGGGGGAGTASSPNDATWIHRFFPGTLWTSPGGDYSATVSATQSVDDVGTYVWGSSVQLVADVQGWVNAAASNFGWILVGGENTQPTAKRFNTRENLDAATRPVLTVTYSTTVGVERETWGGVQRLYR